MNPVASCELCTSAGGVLLWQDARLRVVHVDDAQYPGFLRVIWRDHVAEMSDLPAADRGHLLDVVIAAEAALRTVLRPDKINLASLGNMTPHLHWHVIPRFRGDPQFPDPVWAASRGGAPVALGMTVAEFERSVSGALAARASNDGR